MAETMTTYLLHGGMIFNVKNASNEAYFRRIAEAVPEGGTALIVLFAAEESRWAEIFETMKKHLDAGLGGKDINYRLASREDFIEECKEADAIVIRGGSTDRLIEALRSYEGLDHAWRGKLVAGSSAGAYALGTYNYDKGGKRIRDGLGFVPSRVLCHFESEDLKERNGAEALAIMESAHKELPLILLRDTEWQEHTV